MALLGDANDASGWAVIGTMAALILTFLTTARRDRNRGDGEAAKRWQTIAESTAARNTSLEQRIEKLLREKAEDKATIARYREEIRHHTPRNTKESS